MSKEISWIKNPIYALMINDWCCEQLGDRKWDKDKILQMLYNSNSEKEFKEMFKQWLKKKL